MDSKPKRKIFNAYGLPQRKNEETSPTKYFQGQMVYVKDIKEVWVPGTVQSVDNNNIKILLSSNQVIQCQVSNVLLRSETNVGEVETLTNLSPLNEATVLCCINSRYYNHKIYTSAGSTVIALNPFTNVDHLYTEQAIQSYNQCEDEEKLPPHIYKIAQEAYKNLVRELGGVNQSIIVSGESGAGKTVSAKHLLRYLTHVSNTTIWCKDSSVCERKRGDLIQNKILDSNPILEAFGNAATPRNNNSSRFGKYVQLQFNRCGEIQGGAIQTYLLEKTRAVHHGDGEFNFHIFYQMMRECENVPSWLRYIQEYLKKNEFNNLPYNDKDLTEGRKLNETLSAMTDIGISHQLQECIFQLLSAILYLSNINFTPIDEESSEIDDDPVTMTAMEKASQLLGLSSDQLEKVFLHRNIQSGSKTRRSVFVKPVSITDAKNRRDCLIMLLYSRLFEWLVDFINQQIQSNKCYAIIGLLDIYGFEMFDTNSLEQLCINYANEKIQQHYVCHFLKDLQKEYEMERVEWTSIAYTDNQPCLDALEGKQSIFGILNEEVYLNRKSNIRMLAERLLEIGMKTTPTVKKPRKAADQQSFIISHYAGDVTYAVNELVTKNKDNIPVEIVNLLKSSENDFTQNLFSTYDTTESPGKKKKTVLAKFKSSLDELMTSLGRSDVHYIRCIKPNQNSEASVFDRAYVMQQLKASGILETVEICQHGYPCRIVYWEFLQRYGLLIPEAQSVQDITSSSSENDQSFDPIDTLMRKQMDLPNAPKRTPTPKKTIRRRTGMSPGDHARRCCAAILKVVFGSQHMIDFRKQFGKSKLFLLQSQIEKLEMERAKVMTRHITVLQCAVRRFLIRKKFHRKYMARKIWHCWLRHKKRCEEIKRKTAAFVIQRAYRSWKKSNMSRKIQQFNARNFTVDRDEEDIVNESHGSLQDEHKAKISEIEHYTSVKDEMQSSDSHPSLIKNVYSKIPGSTVLTNSSNHMSCSTQSFSNQKRLMEQSFSEDELENLKPPLKKLKVACKSFQNLKHVKVSDGILTRRHLPKAGIRFHTRASVLKYGHIAPRKELQCSLSDCLSNKTLEQDK